MALTIATNDPVHYKIPALMIHWDYLLNAVLFATVGVVLLAMAFIIIDWIAPQKLWHEITENKNVAVATFMGLFLLGIALIIASAVHG